MLGIIFSIVAGVAMSIQGVFNTRLGEKIGLWETNTIVQGSAFIITIVITLIWGRGNFSELKSANKLYLLGGALSVIIIFTVMEGIRNLGTVYSISTILVAQLLTAGIIDAFGIFDSKKISFGLNEIIGVIVMIAGIVIFKWKS